MNIDPASLRSWKATVEATAQLGDQVSRLRAPENHRRSGTGTKSREATSTSVGITELAQTCRDLYHAAKKMLKAIERETANGSEPAFPPIGPPPNTDLPLFAYGCFKPRELGWPQIQDLCKAEKLELNDFAIRRRDGLALLVRAPRRHTKGYLLTPTTDSAPTFYEKIGNYEPKNQYTWTVIEAGGCPANTLIGSSPDHGSESLLRSSWSAGNDPSFTDGLPTVRMLYRKAQDERRKEQASRDYFPKTSLYTFEAAYLLLWSITERYTALRVGPHRGPMARLRALETSTDFQEAVRDCVTDPWSHSVYDSRSPNNMIQMDEHGSGAAIYWYTLRSNLSHRGKSDHGSDEHRLELGVSELHDVMVTLLLKQYPRITAKWRYDLNLWIGHPFEGATYLPR